MSLMEQHFDSAFSAPNGIQKLRELILTLAMQGKLVPQCPGDLPTSQLLKEIGTERRQLTKVGKIKTRKPLPEISLEQVSYALPTGWQWVRLGSIGEIFNGNSINAAEKDAKYAGSTGLPYIATKDVGYGLDPLDYENGIRIPLDEEKYRIAHEGAVLICAEGGSAGKKCGLTDRDICFGNKLFAIELYGRIPSRFVLYTYLSPLFRASFAAAMTGIIGGVSIAKFTEIPIPLPPLKEQHRIVAKVDQLLAGCDTLERLRNVCFEKRVAVHAAVLSQLLDAVGKESRDDAWAFITQHFSELYAVKENVFQLHKAILQLAIMGKLAPQDPSDPPASQLLKEIESEKRRLTKGGKIKAHRPLREIGRGEEPYALPPGWQWTRLGNAGSFERGKSRHRPRNDRRLFEDGVYPFVQTGDVAKAKQTNNQITSCGSHYNEFGLQQSRLWREGTLCITIAANIAETGFLGMDACIPDSVVAFLSIDDAISKFVKIFIDVAKEDLEHFAPSTAQKNINLEIINDLAFPLPPLPELRRVVAKIDQLTELSKTLEQHIDAAAAKQIELLNTVMAEMSESSCA